MAARFIETHPCEDACGILTTGEKVEGAPVYRCPGCDSRWIELDERVDESQPQAKGLKKRILGRR